MALHYQLGPLLVATQPHPSSYQVGDYRVQFSYSGRLGEEYTVVGRQAGREVRIILALYKITTLEYLRLEALVAGAELQHGGRGGAAPPAGGRQGAGTGLQVDNGTDRDSN